MENSWEKRIEKHLLNQKIVKIKYMSEKVECTDDAIDIEKVNGSKVNNIDNQTFIVRRS